MGTYPFVEGYTYLVKITAQPGPSSTCADAVRFSLATVDVRPSARIDDVGPNPTAIGQTVTFSGIGYDLDGTVTEYQWTSNLSGLLSTAKSFTTSTLPVGTHTISFRVKDNAGFWSPTVETTLVIVPVSIIDNRAPNTSRTGTWYVSDAPNSYGADSLWSRDGSTFTWKFTPDVTGTYDLSMWWTQWASRSANIPVDIQDDGGTTRIYINQQTNGGRWNPLGTYRFVAGYTYLVKITAQPGPSSTCADAVRFSLLAPHVLPWAQIYEILPNPAVTGQAIHFDGGGSPNEWGTDVSAYQWTSNLRGVLGTTTSFNLSLPAGTHIISFRVRDTAGFWSPTVTRTLVVNYPATDVIVDNRSTDTSRTGVWSVSGATNPYGPDSLWSRDGSTFTWKYTPTVTEERFLYMWWTEWPSRSANIPVDIEYAGGTQRVYINQQANGGRWNYLGYYSFNPGTPYSVKITAQPGPTSTCADAILFSLAPIE